MLRSPSFSRKDLIYWRIIFQSCFTLFSLFIGYQFYRYFLWISDRSLVQVNRPPSVEGFLPISALMGLKKLVLTGQYDLIHPAGLTIFLAAITISFLLRKGFCGWICPIGFISNLLWKIGSTLKKLPDTPLWFNFPLLSLKYCILAFFLFMIFWRMNLQSLESFIRSPYNIVVDAKMLFFFLAPSGRSLFIITFLTLFSFVLRNFWCRFLCPYGALLGILSFASPVYLKRNESTCIQCEKCEKKCPSGIRVAQKKSLHTPECIGCLACIAACPIDNCLTTRVYTYSFPPWVLPLCIATVFLSFYIWAFGTGHWHQQLAEPMLRKYYTMMFQLGH